MSDPSARAAAAEPSAGTARPDAAPRDALPDASQLKGWCAKCRAEAVLKTFSGGRLLVASPCDCDAGIVVRSAAVAPAARETQETNDA